MEQSTELPNPRKIIYKMLLIRRYLIDESFINETDEKYLTNMIDDIDSRIYVFFPQNAKVGVVTIRQYIEDMQKNNVNRAIIVVKDSITAFAKQVYIDASPYITIECFKENELYIDKLSHVLVPKHEIISETEKDELLRVYKIKEWQLPKILNSDPISKYFGARKGQIFKITRHSENSNEYIYYRLVI